MIEEDGEPKEGNAVVLITRKVMKCYQWNGQTAKGSKDSSNQTKKKQLR